MISADPNILAVELVAEALGPLCAELVLVGGCAVGLLITDKARPPVRQTIDVDLVAQVTTLGDYYTSLMPKLRERGFSESPEAAHMCRWTKGPLVVDIIPAQDVLHHSTNVWFQQVLQQAATVTLRTRQQILLISAPLFIATKLESFSSRGEGNFLHHDIEDIVNVVDGRAELIDEVRMAPQAVQDFLSDEVEALLANDVFFDQLPGHFQPDQASQARVQLVIRRLRSIAGV